MTVPRYIGQRVEITKGKLRGREGVIVAIGGDAWCENIVVVEYEARVAMPLMGIEPGERVRACVHWNQTEPLTRPTGRL